MRVVLVGEFDPCLVGHQWRKALAPLGVDVRICVQRVYWQGSAPDWWLDSTTCDHGSLYECASTADIIILMPCIGQPWSYQPPLEVCGQREPDETHMGGIDWDSLPGKRVALFHGSLLLSAHAERYAAQYRERGYTIAATTLDYVHRMKAHYFPPAVYLGSEPAPLRTDGEGLHVIHSPTAPSLCQTGALEEMAKRLGFVGWQSAPPEADSLAVVSGMPRDALLRLKVRFNAGVDHVRGSFSINSIENAGLGLVNLVAVRPGYRAWYHAHMKCHLPFPVIETMADVHDWLDKLSEDALLTREYQAQGAAWYREHASPPVVARHIAAKLAEIGA